MSYEIVKSIKITENEVIFSADSNNVRPRDFTPRPWPYFTEMLKSQGKEAVELDILKAYEDGTFQPGRQNKYSRAIDRLKQMPEYAQYDWRKDWSAYNREGRKSEAFSKLLLKVLEEVGK